MSVTSTESVVFTEDLMTNAGKNPSNKNQQKLE